MVNPVAYKVTTARDRFLVYQIEDNAKAAVAHPEIDAVGYEPLVTISEHEAAIAALEAKAAEYEAAILRMYFRIHNSQGDLQTALEWSRV